MLSFTLNDSKSSVDKCKDMLYQVDSMLSIVKSGPITRKVSIIKKTLPTEFINAVRTLSHRVHSGKDSLKVYESSRLKPISPTSLGPGQYFKYPLNDSLKLPRPLTLKDFESPKNKSVKILKKNFIRRSPKEHNLMVKERVQKRIEILNMNNLRKRDRFKTEINTKVKDTKKQYFNEMTSLFMPLVMIYGINLIISELIKNKTRIRVRSLLLLGIWYCSTRFLISLRRKLKKIRKMIAAKNIGCITKPFLRFVYNKRQYYRGKVMKHVKFILKMNLLSLLLYRFLRAVNIIQSNFRKFRILKATRILILFNKCLTLPSSQIQSWLSSTQATKFEVLIRYYRETAYKYSKSKIKYLYDTSAVNKKFVRNFVFWQNDSFNQASGRNFTVTLPDPPKFNLMCQTNALIRYINTFDYKTRKKKPGRSIAIEKSYY